MKYFIIIIFLFFNSFVYSETLYYKNINTSEEDSSLMRVEFPEDCLEIIEINNDQSLEFKNNDALEKIVSECNTFLKGKKVRNTFKSGSDKILDTSKKVSAFLRHHYLLPSLKEMNECNAFLQAKSLTSV